MTYRLRNIVLAVGLAALAALLTSFYVANYKRTVQQDEASVTVYVAANADRRRHDRRRCPLAEAPPSGEGRPPHRRAGRDLAAVAGRGPRRHRDRLPGRAGQRQPLQGGRGGRASRPSSRATSARSRSTATATSCSTAPSSAATTSTSSPRSRSRARGLNGGDAPATRVVLRDILVLKAPDGAGRDQQARARGRRASRSSSRVTDGQAQKLVRSPRKNAVGWTLAAPPGHRRDRQPGERRDARTPSSATACRPRQPTRSGTGR